MKFSQEILTRISYFKMNFKKLKALTQVICVEKFLNNVKKGLTLRILYFYCKGIEGLNKKIKKILYKSMVSKNVETQS
jgi:hypothetical protein